MYRESLKERKVNENINNELDAKNAEERWKLGQCEVSSINTHGLA